MAQNAHNGFSLHGNLQNQVKHHQLKKKCIIANKIEIHTRKMYTIQRCNGVCLQVPKLASSAVSQLMDDVIFLQSY